MRAAIVGLAGPDLSSAEESLFSEHPPCGVILFRRNIEEAGQLAYLVGRLRAVLPPSAVLMIDQEGGRVARLRPPLGLEHPSAAALGALFDRDPAAGRQAAFLSGALIGLECRQFGFDVVTAPVLDLRLPEGHEVIGDRAFSADPAAVATLGGAVAEGLLAAGVEPVAKHAPGHGRAPADSHHALPRVTATAAELADDLVPFRRLHHLPWMMVGHVCYEAWDSRLPASLSASVIGGVIRGQIGFSGLLISDDLAMAALEGRTEARAAAALAAGCDVALHCSGHTEENRALLRSCPDLTPRARALMAGARAAAVAARRPTLSAAALAAARAELLA
jgi:beta-N-acetylhexosaminidase